MAFCDSDLFKFIEVDGGIVPIHYRPLGEKEGALYGEEVKWKDVVIKGVSLEKTFEYEDEIMALQSGYDEGSRGVIVVNSRDTVEDLSHEDEGKYDMRWMNRLNKMKITPNTFKEAKGRKPSKNKRTAKPKTEVQKEKRAVRLEDFQELVDVKGHGEIPKNILKFHMRTLWTPPSEMSNTLVPPEHWITPVKRWDLIWSYIDTVVQGYERDYHYVPPGEINEEGIHGPAIYFFDKDNDDLNFEWMWNRDFVYGVVDGGLSGFARDIVPNEKEWYYTSFIPCVDKPPSMDKHGYDLYDIWNGKAESILGVSNISRFNIHEEEYLKYPTERNFREYEINWKTNGVESNRPFWSNWTQRWMNLSPAPEPHV
jgi:hypothetical protein